MNLELPAIIYSTRWLTPLGSESDANNWLMSWSWRGTSDVCLDGGRMRESYLSTAFSTRELLSPTLSDLILCGQELSIDTEQQGTSQSHDWVGVEKLWHTPTSLSMARGDKLPSHATWINGELRGIATTDDGDGVSASHRCSPCPINDLSIFKLSVIMLMTVAYYIIIKLICQTQLGWPWIEVCRGPSNAISENLSSLLGPGEVSVRRGIIIVMRCFKGRFSIHLYTYHHLILYIFLSG